MARTLFDNKEDCMGCTACYAACPVNAIQMLPDEEGFLYPQIQEQICIECGKCHRVCPQKKKRDSGNSVRLYAVKHANAEIREKSTSGGMFSLLARYVEEKNGVIYGAAFDEKFVVRHMRAESEEQWKRFCTSKYVQSDLGDVFAQVRRDLEQGRVVLFTGTPCQVDGLKQALSGCKHLEQLITCDIICHGVPSPKVWKDWLSVIKRSKKREIGHINFRDKGQTGWHNSTVTIWDQDGSILLKEGQNEALFTMLFFEHFTVRPSCFQCRYSNLNRPGDITLGDCWGIEKHHPEFDDNKGVSLVICNTEKGEKLFSAVKHQTQTVELEQHLCMQQALETNYPKPKSRDYFWKWYTSTGLVCTAQIMGFTKPRIGIRLQAYAKRMIRCVVKKSRKSEF